MPELYNIDSRKLAEDVYSKIEQTSISNAFIQGSGGLFGTLVTASIDVFAIGIYSTLWDEIRGVYGHEPYDSTTIKTLIPKLGKEIITDVALDKVLGYIPVVGIYTNAICAKTLTWRLGILFAMLSARGSSVPDNEAIKAIQLIREVYPQKDMFSFKTPDRESVIRLIVGVENLSEKEFNSKVTKALSVFD